MSGESYCVFGAEAMLNLLESFMSQEAGTRESNDIEFLHRMRVGTRRLREALALFCECFSKADFFNWELELRKLTRALGKARDLDVQAASITALVEGSMSEKPAEKPGLERLILRLKQKRGRSQKLVIKSLDYFAKSGFIRDIKAHLGKRLGTACVLPHNDSADEEARVTAALYLKKRIVDVMGYDHMIRKPENVYEQHEMRKAFKRLRYAMELFEPLYGDKLIPHIKTVKGAQDILGALHDCDVWIEGLPVFLEKEKIRIMDWQGNLRGFSRLEAGIKYLLASKMEERAVYYKDFMDFWLSICSGRWWDALISAL